MAELLISEKSELKGTRESSDYSVPLNATKADIFIDRTYLLDKKVAIACQLFLSLDGGMSWHPWGGFGTVGGKIINSDTKTTELKSGMISNLPEPQNTNRKIRVTLTGTDTNKTSVKCDFKLLEIVK